jgi:hypothetical protein
MLARALFLKMLSHLALDHYFEMTVMLSVEL